MRRWAVALTLALAVLAGCGGDDESSLPEFSASPEATADGQWDQKAKPERPKDVKSEEGLRAYIDYLTLVTPYTLATHDSSVLANLGDPATCVPCARAQDLSESYGNDIVLYEERPTVADLTSKKDPGGDKWVVDTQITLSKSQRVDKTSGEVQSESPEETLGVRYDVMWVGGRWELINYSQA